MDSDMRRSLESSHWRFSIKKDLRNFAKFTRKYLCQSLFLNNFFFWSNLGFLSRTFTIHGIAGEGGGYFFKSCLPLPPASQTLRHQPDDYCRELTSAHSQQPESNREPLVSEHKSLTTKLRALKVADLSLRPKAQACNFIKKEALAQVFSCEFCEISKNTISTEYLQTTASEVFWLCRSTPYFYRYNINSL